MKDIINDFLHENGYNVETYGNGDLGKLLAKFADRIMPADHMEQQAHLKEYRDLLESNRVVHLGVLNRNSILEKEEARMIAMVKGLTENIETIIAKAAEIAWEDYHCEAGPLTMDVHFIELKKLLE